jgi:hypothetical protein
MHRRLCLFLLLLFLCAFAPLRELSPVFAQAANRAGLVVVHGDGAVVTQCVAFDTPSISGYELLERSGLDLRMEVSGMGPTICRLDEEGCDAGQNCFCHCRSGPCTYWTYWRLVTDPDSQKSLSRSEARDADFSAEAEPAGWRYSNMGAGNTQVTDGMVEGWVWGDSAAGEDARVAPPPMTFDEICSAEVVADAPAAPAADTPSGRLQAPVGLALVAGLPLIAGAIWWVARQARRTP